MAPTIDIKKWKCLLNRDMLRWIQFFLFILSLFYSATVTLIKVPILGPKNPI